MFRWHQELERLNIPASQVLHLERSLSMVQVALPGLPSQEATAYLCVFAAGKGVRVALVLHLHTSHRLAFYMHEQEFAPAQEAGRLIEEGILFAESMGFMLSDMDYRMLGSERRNALWESLPLRCGAEGPSPVSAARPAASACESAVSIEMTPPEDSSRLRRASLVETIIELAEEAPPELPISNSPAQASPESETEAARESAVSMEVTLPADSNLKRPASLAETIIELAEEAPPDLPISKTKKADATTSRGATLRTEARSRAPSAEELSARRQNLLENLGRFLASL